MTNQAAAKENINKLIGFRQAVYEISLIETSRLTIEDTAQMLQLSRYLAGTAPLWNDSPNTFSMLP